MMIDQTKISQWIHRACGVHLLILLILCLTLPTIATTATQQAIFQFIVYDLKIITQMDSLNPFVSVVSSSYALCSGIGLFLVCMLIFKKLYPNYSLRVILYARFADQLTPIEDLRFLKLMGQLLIWMITVLLAYFHFCIFNSSNAENKTEDIYDLAFHSRWGIFIVQSLASFWVLSSCILFLLWYLQFEMWLQTAKNRS